MYKVFRRNLLVYTGCVSRNLLEYIGYFRRNILVFILVYILVYRVF